jgi:hypothetical protein
MGRPGKESEAPSRRHGEKPVPGKKDARDKRPITILIQKVPLMAMWTLLRSALVSARRSRSLRRHIRRRCERPSGNGEGEPSQVPGAAPVAVVAAR